MQLWLKALISSVLITTISLLGFVLLFAGEGNYWFLETISLVNWIVVFLVAVCLVSIVMYVFMAKEKGSEK
jgi:hypothetical protein